MRRIIGRIIVELVILLSIGAIWLIPVLALALTGLKISVLIVLWLCSIAVMRYYFYRYLRNPKMFQPQAERIKEWVGTKDDFARRQFEEGQRIGRRYAEKLGDGEGRE